MRKFLPSWVSIGAAVLILLIGHGSLVNRISHGWLASVVVLVTAAVVAIPRRHIVAQVKAGTNDERQRRIERNRREGLWVGIIAMIVGAVLWRAWPTPRDSLYTIVLVMVWGTGVMFLITVLRMALNQRH